MLRGHRKASANSAKGSKENLSKEVIFKLNIEVYQVGMKKKGHFCYRNLLHARVKIKVLVPSKKVTLTLLESQVEK